MDDFRKLMEEQERAFTAAQKAQSPQSTPNSQPRSNLNAKLAQIRDILPEHSDSAIELALKQANDNVELAVQALLLESVQPKGMNPEQATQADVPPSPDEWTKLTTQAPPPAFDPFASETPTVRHNDLSLCCC